MRHHKKSFLSRAVEGIGGMYVKKKKIPKNTWKSFSDPYMNIFVSTAISKMRFFFKLTLRIAPKTMMKSVKNKSHK